MNNRQAKKCAETYSGKPCIHGHGTKRYVSNGQCVECRRGWERARYLRKRRATEGGVK